MWIGFPRWLGHDRRQAEKAAAEEAFALGLNHNVHEWFGLTRAHYLTVPRSLLESMPPEWQRRFCRCLDELDDTFDWRPDNGRYWCRLKDRRGRFVRDRLMEYRDPDYDHIASLRRQCPPSI